MEKIKKELPPADKENARFKWKMNLKDTRNQDFIIGYSKFIGNPEASEPFAVFKSKIIMLHTKGYIDKCNSIEFYNNQTLELLVILKHDKFDLAPKLIATPQSVFLTDFYEYRRKNQDMKNLLSPKIGFSKDQYLNIENLGKEASENRLTEYLRSLAAMGFERNQVERFKFEYEQKYRRFS